MAPLQTAGKPAKSSGFTLIELLVTVAILVVIVTLAIPSFSSLLQRNAVAVSSNALITDLSRARSAAMTNRRNVTAYLSLDADGSGWAVQVGETGTELLVDDRGGVSVGVSAFTLASPPANISLPLEITFNSLGRISGHPAYRIEFANASDSSSVCVEFSGEINVCSP